MIELPARGPFRQFGELLGDRIVRPSAKPHFELADQRRMVAAHVRREPEAKHVCESLCPYHPFTLHDNLNPGVAEHRVRAACKAARRRAIAHGWSRPLTKVGGAATPA